jgi:hypothetical protein
MYESQVIHMIQQLSRRTLKELSDRNPGIETSFRRIDANRFSAKVYKNGQTVSRCTVFVGDRFVSGGIAYSSSETTESNSYNENLTVEADDQSMYWRGMGMSMTRRGDQSKLSQEGAAEFYWTILIDPLQNR